MSGTIWPGRSLPISFARSAGGLGAARLHQHLAQVLVEADRRVGGGVGAAGDADVDLPERDLVGHEHRGLEAGVAGLLDVVGRGGGGERGAEHGLAGEVEVARVLEHGAGDDLADLARPGGRSGRRARRSPRSACPGWTRWRRARWRGRRGSGCRPGRLHGVGTVMGTSSHVPSIEVIMPDRTATRQLTALPPGRFIAKQLGLPESRPLRRYEPGQPLLAGPALVGGDGRLGDTVGEDARRRRRRDPPGPAADDEDVKLGALVFDATGIEDSTRPARRCTSSSTRRSARSARAGGVVVLGTPPGAVASRRAGGRPARARGLRPLRRQGARARARRASSSTSRPAPRPTPSRRCASCSAPSSAYVSGQVIRIGAGEPTDPAGLGAAAGRPRRGRHRRLARDRRGDRRARSPATARTSSASTCPPRARTLAEVANGSAAPRCCSTSPTRTRPRGWPSTCRSATAAPTWWSTTPASRATRRSRA